MNNRSPGTPGCTITTVCSYQKVHEMHAYKSRNTRWKTTRNATSPERTFLTIASIKVAMMMRREEEEVGGVGWSGRDKTMIRRNPSFGVFDRATTFQVLSYCYKDQAMQKLAFLLRSMHKYVVRNVMNASMATDQVGGVDRAKGIFELR